MSKSLSQFRQDIGYPQQDNNTSDKFALSGGLAIEEVAAIGDPAKLIFCKNYEPNYSGGYRSKGGCEPVDGHRQPSAFVYQLLPVTITNAANMPTSVGQQINQAHTSQTDIGPFFLGWETIGGQLYIVLTNTLKALITSSLDYPFGNAVESYLDVKSFAVGTTLYTNTVGTPHNFATTSGAATFLTDVDKAYFYIALARKTARNLIGPVGGTICKGPSLGVFDVNGHLFAIRALNAGGAGMFSAAGPGNAVAGITPGWLQVNLGSIVYFTACNSTALAEGAIVTGGGGSSCVVKRLIIMFGTVGGGDACGYFSTQTIVGASNMGGNGVNLQVGGVTVAVTPASGNVVVANTLPATGNYRFKRWNFTGVANASRAYGISGKGTAFEVNGSVSALGSAAVFTPLITGQGLTVATFNATPTLDTPNVIEIAHDQLFLGYPGGNLTHSGYQDPTSYTAVSGADQRELGEDITNIVGNINNTVVITTRNRMRILYGDVNENYQLRDLNTEAGAYPFTAVPIGGLCFLTDEGVNFYDQTAQFGNFSGISLSQGINSLIKSYMSSGAGPVEAVIQRDHSFYRLYFDTGVCFTFCIVGKELRGIGRCEYDMGSTLYITLLNNTVPALHFGDTITNADGSASFTLDRSFTLSSGILDSFVVTKTRIDPSQWAVGSSLNWNGAAFATVVSATVNTAKNFWSVASTITNGSGVTPSGERTYFCCDDGFVYEDDVGGAFGVIGASIDTALQTQFWYGQMVNNEKYFRQMYVDLIGADAFSNISFGAEYDDGYGYRSPEAFELSTRYLAASAFDQNSVYGVGFYGGAGKNVLRKPLHGTGVGISILANSSSTIAFPHTLQAVQLAYAVRPRRNWR